MSEASGKNASKRSVNAIVAEASANASPPARPSTSVTGCEGAGQATGDRERRNAQAPERVNDCLVPGVQVVHERHAAVGDRLRLGGSEQVQRHPENGEDRDDRDDAGRHGHSGAETAAQPDREDGGVEARHRDQQQCVRGIPHRLDQHLVELGDLGSRAAVSRVNTVSPYVADTATTTYTRVTRECQPLPEKGQRDARGRYSRTAGRIGG